MVQHFCFRCELFQRPGGERCAWCGEALDLPRQATLVDGRYSVSKPLGSGAMGSVELAQDLALRRPVALKHFKPGATPNAASVRAFHEEAAALASVRHENVVQVYSFGLHGEGCYFAMEYVQGASLHSVLEHYRARQLRLSTYRALAILRSVAAGLAAVHHAGLVHCDVKPSNVVLEAATGRPVLVDFGIAVRSGPDTRSADTALGTPAYMAPEQIIPGRLLTPHTDVYALGCMAYDVLSGSPPFPAMDAPAMLQRHLDAPVPLLSEKAPELAPLDGVLQRAMAKNPQSRFDSARAFGAALQAQMAAFGHSLLGAEALEVPPENAAETPTEREAAVRVLLVDDDRAFTLLCQQAVRVAFAGLRVHLDVALSGLEALHRSERAPQLVVLDHHMPGMDGADTLALLRERPGGGSMRVLVCSAGAPVDAIQRFALLGVTDFCQKPLRFDALVSALRALGERNGWVSPGPKG